jgi:RND family efflux transporter MFP subunit
MPVVRISENKLLRLLLPVPESAVPRIHLGERVEVRVPVLNRSFVGKVARFSDRLSTQTRTMVTEVDVQNPSLLLIPGMYAEVNLQLDSRSNVLAIPVSAVDLTSATTQVYKVAPDGTVEVVPVKLGLETANRAEVLAGLHEGDMVVIGSRAGLKQGYKVKPKVVDIAATKAES